YAKSNVAFHQGYIEDLRALPMEENSVDVIVSNCVVNLSPRKDLVLQEAFRLLKPGGELYFSDVFVDRRLPQEVAFDPLLHSECLGGALYEGDFIALAKKTGFVDPREISRHGIDITSNEITAKVGAARFVSVTLRLFKLDGLDGQCEDYGQSTTYQGTIESSGAVYWLDDHHAFEAGRPERICRNTALMLQETRLAKHFTVVGEAKTHFGVFPCGPTMAAGEGGQGGGGVGLAVMASGGSCCC
ncbi:MAG: methyltransferase domain-containing protein, partial [Deltaproteobacteria bacterium]|nr:methyltransferase domain-containing protein [Deltaproteobacteria bacterium]